MIEYTVRLTRAAEKDLDRLTPSDRGRINQAFCFLEERPFGKLPRMKRLKGFPFPLYRLRAGDFRILYRVDETVVTVMRVFNRKNLERTIQRLRMKRQ